MSHGLFPFQGRRQESDNGEDNLVKVEIEIRVGDGCVGLVGLVAARP